MCQPLAHRRALSPSASLRRSSIRLPPPPTDPEAPWHRRLSSRDRRLALLLARIVILRKRLWQLQSHPWVWCVSSWQNRANYDSSRPCGNNSPIRAHPDPQLVSIAVPIPGMGRAWGSSTIRRAEPSQRHSGFDSADGMAGSSSSPCSHTTGVSATATMASICSSDIRSIELGNLTMRWSGP